MGLFDIGRVCVKIAGRDANCRCVIVDKKDEHTFIIDGETRRRACNIKHLEPLNQTLDIKNGASTKEVATAFKKLGIEVRETKPKKAAAKPKAVRKAKVKPEPKAKAPKAEKKPAKPKAEKAVKAEKAE